MSRLSREEFESKPHSYWLDLYDQKMLEHGKGLISSDEMWSVNDAILGDYGMTLAGINVKEPIECGELIMSGDGR